MSDPSSLSDLRTEHASLEQRLESEKARPYPDPVAIAEIKKQKLQVKDEIARRDLH